MTPRYVSIFSILLSVFAAFSCKQKEGGQATITSVSSTKTDGTWGAATSIDITVVFSKAVTVKGVPYLQLETGTTDQRASYSAGSGTTTLSFRYIVQAGDSSSDLDYSSATALNLNSGSINDDSGVEAALTLPSPGASGSLGANKALAINTTAPTVANVTASNANGTYGPSNTISVQIVFSAAVNVTGTPKLTLETGTTDRTASYASGSGTTTLVFTYTPQSGDSSADLDYTSTTALALNGGLIADTYGNAATLTLATPGAANSLGANKNIVIAASGPTVSSVTSTTANGTYGAGQVIAIKVTFSRAVTVDTTGGTPRLTLNALSSSSTQKTASYNSGTGTTELIFNYTVAAGDNIPDFDGDSSPDDELDYASASALSANGGTMVDSMGNSAILTLANPGAAGSLSANQNLIVDTTAPTVSRVTSSTANGTYGTGQTIVVQVVFSEAVTVNTGGGTPTLQLECGGTDPSVNYTAGSTTTTLTFNYTIGAGENATDLTYVATTSLALNGGTILDAAGNAATLTLASPTATNSLASNKDLVVDTTAPTVSSVSSTTSTGIYGLGATIDVRVTFSEAVTVAGGTPQLVLNTGQTINYSSTSSTILIFSYQVQLGDNILGLDHSATNSLSLNGATIRDAASNDATLTLPTPGASSSLSANASIAVQSINFVETISANLTGTRAVVTAPDGRHVYAVGTSANKLVAYSRNMSSGALTVVETHADGDAANERLNSARGLAISPDGRSVYATSYTENTITVYRRNLTTGANAGKLTFNESECDTSVTGCTTSGVTGLDGANGVAVSPDGKNVYVTGYTDNALVVYQRDVSNTATVGNLTYAATHVDGAASVDGLGGAFAVTVSPDGLNVYAAGETDDGVAVFTRNLDDGSLTFLEVKKDGVSSVDGLDGVTSVTVSPDGLHVYATGRADNSVAVFSRNVSTGALTYVEVKTDGSGSMTELGGARHVSLSPDGRLVYVTAYADNALTVFSRNFSTGALTLLESRIDGGLGFNGLAGAYFASPSFDGRHLYVSGNQDDLVAVLSLMTAQPTKIVYSTRKVDGSGSVDGLDGVTSVSVSPDGKAVYAAGYTDSLLSVFSRSLTDFSLSYSGYVQNTNVIAGPFAVAFAPGTTSYYVPSGNAATDNVSAYRRSPSAETSTYVDIESDSGTVGLDGANNAAVSPDGRHVYVISSTDNGINAYVRTLSTGALAYLESHCGTVGGGTCTNVGQTELDGAKGVAVSPDGLNVFVAGSTNGRLAIYERNPVTGALTYQTSKSDAALGGATTVVVSPDGLNVYVTGSSAKAVAVYTRDPSVLTDITYSTALSDVSAGGATEGLDGAYGLVVSADGKNVYASGSVDNSVVVFTRNAATGALTEQSASTRTDGSGGVDGLAGVRGLAVCPDGRSVYAAGFTDDSLAIFDRK